MEFLRCQSGQRCVASTPDGAAVVHQPGLCHRCIESVQAQYDELPKILSVLEMFKGGLWGTSGEAKVSTGKSVAPCPLNVDALDVELSIGEIRQCIGTMRIVDLANGEDGAYWIGRIRKAYDQADQIIGIDRHWSRRFSPCPGCSQRTLGNWSGEDTIRCESCPTTLTREEYAQSCLTPQSPSNRR